MITELAFAVVGHPNKGKSSIVSTLSRNDSIEISARSGTTTEADCYEVTVLDTGYKLYDTPGFQRPRQVLNWIKSRAENASERPQAVKEFVNNAEAARAFPDEVQLLKPIIDGASILYVVDCSNPYGPEYEMEMEILRWCGQPRMALINPITNTDYLKDWQDALGQYFNLVQVFNPIKANLDNQIELMDAFQVLSPVNKNVLAS
ncbi:MAG: 50S ribosome-binding GTPase, partial [Gammaproteobacteria bacterium]|nr:50S ribosome-binding GTPase [Gammaproteobacteria bacterium]